MISRPAVSAGIADSVPWYIATATTVTGTTVTLTSPLTGQTLNVPCGRGSNAPSAGQTVLVIGNGDGSNDIVIGWKGAPPAPTGPTNVYVANYFSGSVSKVATATMTQTVTPLAVIGYPQSIVADPTGTYLYVTSRGGSGYVTKIDVATFTVAGQLTLGFQPAAIAIDPTNTHLYVANATSNAIEQIDVATFSMVGSLAIADTMSDVVVDPSGTYVYACGFTTLTKIDAATFTAVGSPLTMPANLYAIAIDSTGTYGYGASTGGQVTKVDLAAMGILNTLTSGFLANLTDIVIDGTDSYVYVVNHVNSLNGATVEEIDLATWAVSSSAYTDGNNPTDLGIDRATGHLYVTNEAGLDNSNNGPLAQFKIPGLTARVTDLVGQHADGIALA